MKKFALLGRSWSLVAGLSMMTLCLVSCNNAATQQAPPPSPYRVMTLETQSRARKSADPAAHQRAPEGGVPPQV